MPFSPIQPTNLQYQQYLSQTGLTTEQAAVYEILLKEGSLPARRITQKSPYKRGHIYKLLEELEKLGLVVRHDAPGQVSLFEPQHPTKLKEIVEEKEKSAKKAAESMSVVMDDLVSSFNLISGKPGVQVFEGLEGALKVLEDSLTATTEIYSYIDNEAVEKNYPDINKEYVEKRKNKKIKKKMIMIDSPYTKKYEQIDDEKFTDIRLIDSPKSFATVMQIYDTKVSYITIPTNTKKIISIIIEHPSIAQMHKALFETMWMGARPLSV